MNRYQTTRNQSSNTLLGAQDEYTFIYLLMNYTVICVIYYYTIYTFLQFILNKCIFALVKLLVTETIASLVDRDGIAIINRSFQNKKNLEMCICLRHTGLWKDNVQNN